MKHYEHRADPQNPAVVQVREVVPYQSKYERDHAWKTYLECDSPAQARRVLALLYPDDAERVVCP